MSETVHYRGILTEVERLDNETLEDQCMRLLSSADLPSYYDSCQEMIEYESCENYIVHNGILYSIDKNKIDLDEDIFNSSKNKDDSISFEVKYYNGGCGFGEAIKEALNKINN